MRRRLQNNPSMSSPHPEEPSRTKTVKRNRHGKTAEDGAREQQTAPAPVPEPEPEAAPAPAMPEEEETKSRGQEETIRTSGVGVSVGSGVKTGAEAAPEAKKRRIRNGALRRSDAEVWMACHSIQEALDEAEPVDRVDVMELVHERGGGEFEITKEAMHRLAAECVRCWSASGSLGIGLPL